MTNLVCAKPLQGDTMRVTRLDECGNPEYGECGYATSDGFVSITMTPNVEEGERFLARNAAGRAIVNQRSAPILNWYDVTAVFQEVDFELFSLITGLPIYENDTGETIGVQVTGSDFATGNFALEAWMGTSEQACNPGDPYPFFMYNLLPWVTEGAIMEDIVIANQLITFTVTSRTRAGNAWGVGPYDVVRLTDGTPSPLYTAIETDTHHLPIWTQLAPPEASCGCLSLSS